MKRLIVALVLIIVCATGVFAQFSLGGGGDYNYADLQFSLLNQDPLPAWAGQTVELNFNIQNNGVQGAKNVEVVLIPDYPFSLAGSETGKRTINEIAAFQRGEDSVSLSFNLYVDPDASEAMYDVELEYSIDGTKYSDLDPFDVNVKAKESILTLEKMTTEPTRVSPGEEAEMRFDLGVSGGKSLQDIVIALEVEELPISIIGSSNKKVIRRLDSDTTESVVFNLIVGPDAESKVYDIPVTATYYEVGASEAVEYDGHISLVVDRKPEYVLNLEESEVYTADQNGNIVLSMSNIGPTDINYVTLEIVSTDDYEVISTDKVYLGNLESDDFETTEFKIFAKPTDKSKIDLQLITTYKDSYNKYYEEKIVLPLRLYSASEAKEYGLVTDGNNTLWLVVVIVVLAAGGYWYYRRKKRKAVTKK